MIAAGTNGIPPLVKKVCDNSLPVAFGEKRPIVSAADVRWVLTNMGMDWSELDLEFAPEAVCNTVILRKGHREKAATASPNTI